MINSCLHVSGCGSWTGSKQRVSLASTAATTHDNDPRNNNLSPRQPSNRLFQPKGQVPTPLIPHSGLSQCTFLFPGGCCCLSSAFKMDSSNPKKVLTSPHSLNGLSHHTSLSWCDSHCRLLCCPVIVKRLQPRCISMLV